MRKILTTGTIAALSLSIAACAAPADDASVEEVAGDDAMAEAVEEVAEDDAMAADKGGEEASDEQGDDQGGSNDQGSNDQGSNDQGSNDQ